MGHCKLCGYERKLIKAHIVPEPFWPSNDEGTPKILSNTEGVHPRRSPIGVYDETILCETCDNKLGVLDQHAVEHVLNSKTRSPIEHEGKVIGYKYESACPVIMRTFIASVAWRAAMSVHLFYERVKLGPYDEAIKSALCGEGELAPSIQAISRRVWR